MCEKFIQLQLWGTATSAIEPDTSPNIVFDESSHVATVNRSDIIKLNVRNFIETYYNSIQVSNPVLHAINQDMKQSNAIDYRFYSNPSHAVNYPHSSPKTFTTPELLNFKFGTFER
jgi:hypothetical protein